MAKDKLSDYDGVTAGNNTDIGGISIDEGMYPSTVNNSLRELTKQLGAFADGTDGIDVLNLHDDDASASIKIQAPAAVTTTTTLTLPDGAGSNGQVLTTNGSGTLSWSTAGGISDIVQDTTPELGGTLSTNGNDITFGDNNKAIFGAGSDLQIYHDGTKSVIADVTGAGNFHIRGSNVLYIQSDDGGENYAVFNDNGSASLYYDNSKKIETTSGGIDVTGTVTADGLTVSGATEFQDNPVISNGSPELTLETTNASHTNWQIAAQENLSQAFEISSGQRDADASNDTWTKRFTVLDNGDISFYDSTGVTQGLFWDASTQSLGLGTTAPSNALTITSSGSNFATMRLEAPSNTTPASFQIRAHDGDFDIRDANNNATRMTIDSRGDVNIYGTDNRPLAITSFNTVSAGAGWDLDATSGNGVVSISTSGTERMRLDSSGRLGLGTTAPTNPLHISSSAGEAILISNSNASGNSQIKLDGATDFQIGTGQASSGFANKFFLYDATNAATRMVVDNSGNVGINTASPTRTLDIQGDSATNIPLVVRGGSSQTTCYIAFNDPNTTGEYYNRIGSVGNNVVIHSNNAERMRVDSSGNVLVAKTSATTTDQGVVLRNNGEVYATQDGDKCLVLNRKTSDGQIASFRKDNTEVGSIGTSGGHLTIGANGTTGGLRMQSNGYLTPWNMQSNVSSDATLSLGQSSARFTDLYLSGKTYISDGGAGAPAYTFGNDTDTGIFRPTGNQIGFTTGGTERMRIDAGGNCLVGKTATSANTAGVQLEGQGVGVFTRDGDVSGIFNRKTSNGTIVQFRKDNVGVGSISVTGSGTTYNTTSDIRLKTDIAPIADATDKLMAMNAVTHKWKAEPDADAVHGFIAQEMAEIVPEAVSKGESEDDMWSMDYGRITPVLVAALQDAVNEIKTLKERVAELEAK